MDWVFSIASARNGRTIKHVSGQWHSGFMNEIPQLQRTQTINENLFSWAARATNFSHLRTRWFNEPQLKSILMKLYDPERKKNPQNELCRSRMLLKFRTWMGNESFNRKETISSRYWNRTNGIKNVWAEQTPTGMENDKFFVEWLLTIECNTF